MVRARFVGILFVLATAHAVAEDYVRLGDDVVPTSQSIHLTLDADQPSYHGTVRIELEARVTADRFRFHSAGHELASIVLTGAGGEISLEHGREGDDVVRVTPATPLAPGPYTLTVELSGRFDTRASSLYRMEKDGLGYVFSDFEPDGAREAFPCFDEPLFKIPFQVSLKVPERHLALSNTPIAEETSEAGWRTVVFEPTPPLPTYLLALAVGPLETVPIPGLGVPGRVVTVRGQSHLAGAAVAATPPILKALEAYFGRPYPFKKLDLIAIPEFLPGAMENPGAVTYRDTILLVDPRAASVAQLRGLAEVTAHELAHMWFGDLVTMKWWDDLWLNESFASWMGDKISAQLFPEYGAELFAVRSAQGSMTVDARTTTIAIRRPVASTEDAVEDLGLAYGKGKRILGMFEHWIGPETFRRGVLAYLDAHAWGSATAEDLWRALEKAAGRPLRAAMATFLEQPGVPRVDVERLDGPRLRLTQQRFLHHGAHAPPQSWQIPVRLKYATRRGEGPPEVHVETVLLATESLTVELATPAPPEWVFPDAGANGYYRWSLAAEELRALAARAREILEPRERIALIGNLGALLRAGTLGGDVYLEVLGGLADDPEPLVVTSVIAGLSSVETAFVPAELEAAWAAYVRRAFSPVLERFGREKAAGEDEAVTLMRPSLLAWLGDEGRDPEVLAYARELAGAYLAGSAEVDPSLAGTMLRLAALQGDMALCEQYIQRFESAEVPAERSRFMSALGTFEDPEIHTRVLRYSLAEAVRPNEMFSLQIASSPEGRDRAFRFFMDNYEAITSRLPPVLAGYMPYFASGCSPERLEQARRFFALPEHQAAGTGRHLEKVTEQVMECAGLRAREGAAAADYLRRLFAGS